jgi:hypothetical protein
LAPRGASKEHRSIQESEGTTMSGERERRLEDEPMIEYDGKDAKKMDMVHPRELPVTLKSATNIFYIYNESPTKFLQMN